MVAKPIMFMPALAAFCGVGASVALASFQIPTTPIRNPGNAADPATGGVNGAVAYIYNLGVFEVTNTQYVAFLNAVARTDTNNLYNTNMAGSLGGIVRSGSPGAYVYTTVPGRGERPVNFVSFWDAARFANWMHNGRPEGLQSNATTENGAYTLTPSGISLGTVTRNANWRWAIPSKDEWYKAAYHQPVSEGGDADGFWRFPNSSNAINVTQGNFFSNGLNSPTSIGQYGTNFYGAFDMAGNVLEWNDTRYGSTNRGIRGGAFNGAPLTSEAGFSVVSGLATNEQAAIGFRLVNIPGPSSIAVVSAWGLFVSRRRR